MTMKRGPIEADRHGASDRVTAVEAERAAGSRTFARGEKVLFSVAGGDEIGGVVTRCERNELMRMTVVTIVTLRGETRRIEASRVRKARNRKEVALCC